MGRRPYLPVRIAVAALTALAVLSGCSERATVTRPAPRSAPLPDSPANAVRLFEWGWNQRDTLAVREVLAADFRFVFALGDSTGNLFRDDPLGRETMLRIVRHLFVGGGCEPPANTIVLRFDSDLLPAADGRPGMDPGWHKEVVTGVDLTIKTDDQNFRLTGFARFFVVRGDSAVIPADLAARGFGPDSTRWYIQQWNDETLGGEFAMRAGALRPMPTGVKTWGAVLALYR